MVLRDGVFTLTGDHDQFHGSDKQFIQNVKLENAVKERCIENLPIKDIFDQEAVKYPEATVSYISVLRNIQRAKSIGLPPVPDSFSSAHQSILEFDTYR